MTERVSVEPELGNVEFATMGENRGTVLLTVAARNGTALRDLQLSIYASPDTGEWILTVNDSGSNAPKVEPGDRFGREWHLSWPKSS